jgi:hypothetical protein
MFLTTFLTVFLTILSFLAVGLLAFQFYRASIEKWIIGEMVFLIRQTSLRIENDPHVKNMIITQATSIIGNNAVQEAINKQITSCLEKQFRSRIGTLTRPSDDGSSIGSRKTEEATQSIIMGLSQAFFNGVGVGGGGGGGSRDDP